MTSITDINSIDINERATYAGFARLVGVSRQAIQNNTYLNAGGTYHEWLQQYCERLHTQATRHNNDELRSTIIRGKLSKARKTEIETEQLLSSLVRADGVRKKLIQALQHMTSTLDSAGLKIIEEIERQYKIKVPEELIKKYCNSALSEIKSFQSGNSEGIKI